MPKVDILMATYNGAQHIKTQICSIISQSFTHWRLLIHDDGSTDDTVDIVKQMAQFDSRIVLIEDGVICGGAAGNFMHTIKFADADFVMFADQDDIWFDNKVETMLEMIRSKDNTTPQLLFTNLYVWIPEQGIAGHPARTYPQDLRHFLFLNTAMHGCISIFNRPLLDLMKRWQGATAMHDQTLQLLGLSLGNVSYSDLPLMLYRRHNSSVTGDTVTNLNDVSRLAKSGHIPVLFDDYYRMVAYFYEEYYGQIPENDKKTVKLFLDMKEMGKSRKIMSVLRGGFKIYNSSLRLIAKITLRKYIA